MKNNSYKYISSKERKVQDKFKVFNYKYCLLLLIIIFITQISETNTRQLESFSSEIKIIFKGKGTQYLLNKDFFPNPSSVNLNGHSESSCSVTCELDKEENEVVLKFDESLSNCNGMFADMENIIKIDFSNFDFSQVKDMSWMFYGCYNLEEIIFGNADTSNLENMAVLFQSCSKLTSVDLSSFDLSLVKDMSWMFNGCSNLEKVEFGNTDTSSLENIEVLFQSCSKLTSIDLSIFDLSKVKDMLLWLPYHLKPGIMKWNQHEIGFDNNSGISTEAFSPTAGLGKTINFLILDEFAWCPKNDVELFYQNVIPTITTQPNAHVAIMSTQNGFNLFYKIFKAAQEKKNIYKDYTVDWFQVPDYNPKTKKWEKRTEEWKKKMIGILGSEEAFYYQYGTKFSASDLCIVSRECLSVLRDKAILFDPNENKIDIFLQRIDCLYWRPDFNFEELKTGYFIILADLAEGGGGDSDSTVFNILQLVEKDKFKQVGYWKCNNLDLEHAALEYWLLSAQLFNDERTIFSIEWNTYGALFYQYILDLNEDDYLPEASWRFRLAKDGFDTTRFVQYRKGNEEDGIPGMNNSHRKNIPGIRFSGSNKKTACALLKMELEKFNIDITDLVTIGEIENFEDKNGNGTYKASYGHDDIIMTLCQIPMLKNTPKYKDFVEELSLYLLSNHNKNNNTMSLSQNDIENINKIFGSIGNMIAISVPFNNKIDDNDLLENTSSWGYSIENMYNF